MSDARSSMQPMIGYIDSDWAGDVDDRKSCTENHVIFLAIGPISWEARK